MSREYQNHAKITQIMQNCADYANQQNITQIARRAPRRRVQLEVPAARPVRARPTVSVTAAAVTRTPDDCDPDPRGKQP